MSAQKKVVLAFVVSVCACTVTLIMTQVVLALHNQLGTRSLLVFSTVLFVGITWFIYALQHLNSKD